MKDFTLTLGSITYECRSNAYDKLHQNWSIRAKFQELTLTMDIPLASKVSMDKVLIFVTSLDESLKQVQQDKAKELTFINQLT